MSSSAARIFICLAIAFIAISLLRRHSHAAARSTNTAAPPAVKTLTIAQNTDADTLDPADENTIPTLNIARLLFGTLYRVSPAGQLQPYLAESYQYAEDGKSITFKLRPGLMCEDGEPLTARDAAYSFERAADPKLKFTGNATGFVLPGLGYLGTRVDSKLTFTLLIKKYNPIAIGLISELLISCQAPYEKMTKEEATTHPVSSGPYRLVQWTHDDRIVLERNKYFTLHAPPYDRVIFRVIPESSTRAAELIAGDVDIITNVASDQIDVINNSDTAKVESIASVRRIYVGFNQKQKFASTPGGLAIRNPAVRQAMQYAVDVPTMCEALLRTPCARAATMVAPNNDHTGIPPYPYDPDRAERLLDAAGYPRGKDGVRFELTMQAQRDLYGDTNIMLAIGQYLTDIGIKTDVQLLDQSVYVPLMRQHNAGPIYFQGTGGSTWSPLYDISDLTSPSSGTNYTNWADPAFFDGWKQLDATRDPVQMNDIINHMLHVFHDRGPWLLLFFQPDNYGVSNRIHWQPRPDEAITLD
jgi:peptide/nickel transport system substrate-binding protein